MGQLHWLSSKVVRIKLIQYHSHFLLAGTVPQKLMQQRSAGLISAQRYRSTKETTQRSSFLMLLLGTTHETVTHETGSSVLVLGMQLQPAN